MQWKDHKEGHYWVPADGSELWFRPGNEPPTEFVAWCGGHDTNDLTPPEKPIKLDNLEHVRTVKGTRREGSDHLPGWVSNITFSVYLHQTRCMRMPDIVIARGAGGGPTMLLIQQLDFAETMLPVFRDMNPNAFWDLCSALMGTRDKAYRDGHRVTQREAFEAFVQGRLKKRRERGGNTVKVWIEPPKRQVPV